MGQSEPTQEQLNAVLLTDVAKTTRAVAVLTLAALAVAALAGAVHPALELRMGKALALSGAALVGWATYFALHEGYASWVGERPDEVARKRIFASVFLTGLFLALLGTLL